MTENELTYADLLPGTFFVFEDEANSIDGEFVISERVHMKGNGTFTSVCNGKIDCSRKDELEFHDKKVFPVEYGIQSK